MATTVSIAHCDRYESERLRCALRSALEPLGGMRRFVRPGQRVLLKPNFVMARRECEAANTHPIFVVAVAELVREAGGEPFVGDSPALGSARHVASRCGLLPLAREIDLPLVEFRATRRVSSPDGRCRPPRLASQALDADVVINLPKLKAHGQLLLTLAVKNLFGCVRGRRKAALHLLLGDRPIEFSRMIVDVMRVVGPRLSLVDGIVALERTGPTGGDPRPLGLVMAGTDCVAIDRVICEILGVEPDRLLTLVAARQLGVGESDLERIEIVGPSGRGDLALPYAVPPLERRPFRLPDRLAPLSFSPWRIIRGLVRQAWALLRPAGTDHKRGY